MAEDPGDRKGDEIESGGPLPLWRVLEEEHLALGLTLPDSYTEQRDTLLKELHGALAACADASAASDLRSKANSDITGHLMRVFAEQPRRALCFSGGGIRSATFNLGVLQRLAMIQSDGRPVTQESDVSVLERVHYLSTVSGGGYVGGWFSAWARRQGGTKALRERLGPPAQREQQPVSPLEPEPEELRHLRRFSRYLSPRAGLLAADMWTIISTYIRNLLIHWMVLIPALMAVLMVPRILSRVTGLYFTDGGAGGAPGWVRWGLLGAAVLLGGTAFAYAGTHQPSARKIKRVLPWPEAQPRDFLCVCLLPAVLCSWLLSLYWAWGSAADSSLPDLALLIAFGVAISVVGWLGFLWVNPGGDRVEKLLASIAGGVVAGLGLFGCSRALEFLRSDGPEWFFMSAPAYTTVAVPLVLSALSAGGMVFIALVSHPRVRSSSDEDREWWARFGAYVLLTTIVWLVGCTIALLLFELASTWGAAVLSALGGTAGVVAAVLGYSQKTERQGEPPAAGKKRNLVLALAAPLFIVAVLTFASQANSYPLDGLEAWWRPEGQSLQGGRWLGLGVGVVWFVVLGLWAAGVSALVNLNKFTMHSLYRDRLIRAYLGASNPKRRGDPFTGFDPDDNMYLHQMHPCALREEDLADPAAFMGTLATASQGPALGLSRLLEDLRGGQRIMGRLRAEHCKRQVLPLAQRRPYPRWIVQNVLTRVNRLILTRDLRVVLSDAGAAAITTQPEGPTNPAENRRLLDQAFQVELRKVEAMCRREALALERKRDPELGPPLGPLHIVNIALNLVRADDPAWQDRKAQSFTMSPLHCGSWNLGYRPTVSYGGGQGVSLGTALSVSGAAASPNMGYHSNPAVTFVLSFFNVRLGCWLGNPGPAGARTHTSNGPRFGLWPMLTELLGATSSDRGYVYLSDGGHFENLGLYEMVRRRCREIIVCDASCDESCAFEDLGNAVRKVRADMGVEIEFDGRVKIRARDPALKEVSVSYAVARVRYGLVDQVSEDGVLLYIKPSFYGDEPVDVYNYGVRNHSFPHEPTGDQFFSESQFESYRALGQHVADQVAKLRRGPAGGEGRPLLGTLI